MNAPWHGYVREQFQDDLGRWLGGAHAEAADPEDRAIEAILDRLEDDDAAALREWDRLARAALIPEMPLFEEGGLYGFDFVAEGIAVHDDDKSDVGADVWMLGHNGAGDGYVVLPGGEVRLWDHETTNLVSGADFPSLDAFAWGIVRASAAAVGKLPAADVKATLSRQGVPGFAYLLG